jgi:hypothetical protein
MSTANPAAAHAAASTETDFQSFSDVSLKPLLQFITTECLVSMPASALNLVDFVIQLLTENKEHLYQMCRGSKSNNHTRLEKDSHQIASYAESLLKCKTAVSNAVKRRDASFLRRVFDQYTDKGAGGSIPATKLTEALTDADAPIIPDSEAAAAVSISRFDINCNGLMDFSEFVRAVNAPDELELYFQEKQLPALADALRALVGRGSDQLLRVSQLSGDEMQAASSAVCGQLPCQAKTLHEELQRSFAAQFELQTQAQVDGGGKFSVLKEMACGFIKDFHAGLSDRVGMPHLNFKREMMREHCERAGCNVEFTSGNYKITTMPKHEWLYIAGDDKGQRVPCPAENMEHGRRIAPLDELMQLPLAVRAELEEVEVLALILYTGPMFQVYNVILRRCPEDKYKLFKEGGNTFATTIFVLVSAVTKVAKCTRIAEGTLLYRGLGGLMDLPRHFFNADENGASGFVDWGFMSTSSDRDVALEYSGMKQRRPKAMVMVIEATSVDKGADISEFSQYPGEKEFLWVPCSFVQRAQPGAGRVEVVDGGLVTFVPVRVNLNLKSETVKELKEKKKRLHLTSAHAMVEEVRYELGEWAAGAEAADRRIRDMTHPNDPSTVATMSAAIVEQCSLVVKRHEAADVEEYVDDGVFRAMVCEMLDTKAWAKEKKDLWMQDESQLICQLQGWSLRECHRLWQSFLRKKIHCAAVVSSDRVFAGLKLLVSRGLVKRGVREANADGEDVMVQAGGDGWAAEDIIAAAAAGAEAGATDSGGGVWNAARYGHVDSMAALLAARGDVNGCSSDGSSPISIAARNGHTACITLLVSSGGDVNKCKNNGVSPICISSLMGHADCISQFVSCAAEVN